MLAFLFRFLSHLPLPLLHNLGAIAGWLAWLLSPTYRRNLLRQLSQAGLASVRAAAIAEAGKMMCETPWVWLRSHEAVLDCVACVSGREHLDQAMQQGRGILLLTPHLGSFEVVAQYCAAQVPLTALYRKPKQAWMQSLIEEGRGSKFGLAPADLSGVRRLLKALKAGESVLVLPDQVPGNGEGIWAPFFGRPAYTMTLAARLAETGATVLMVYAERLAYGAGYHVHISPLVQPQEGGLAQRTAALNAEIEHLVRQCPGQYLWGYNRYKVPAGVEAPPC